MDTVAMLAVLAWLRAETQRLADAEAPASPWRAQREQEVAALDEAMRRLTMTEAS